MKRFVCFLLSLIIAVSFAGCGGFETVEEHNKKLESSYGSSESTSSQESSSSHNEEEETTEDNPDSGSSQEAGGESSKSGSAKQTPSTKSGGNQPAANQPSEDQPNSAQQPSGQTPTAPPAETTPSQAPEIPQTIQVTISVQCTVLIGNNNLAEPYRPYVPSNGYIQGTTQVTIPKNGTVFDALQALNLNPAPTYTGSVKRKDIYITSIHHIPEKACGGQSGWKYKVNGSIPNLSCSDYTLQGGETIEWYYTEHVFD